ncbi:MAG: hypothetical protein J5859_05945, partial [Clostridia bacterium]|nr:hypothetical protein [Clostridia bacterium]
WSIPGYYDAICRMEERELGSLSLRTKVRTRIFGANGGQDRWETGECTLDRDAFRYVSERGSFVIPAAELPALAFSCGEEFELYINDELHYFYPQELPVQAARWALAADLLAKERRGELKAERTERNGTQ